MELSLTEICLILFVALLLYGGRLPQVAMAVGRAVGEFKRGLRETSDMVRYEIEASDRPRRSDARVRPRLSPITPTFPAAAADPQAATEDVSGEPPPPPSTDPVEG